MPLLKTSLRSLLAKRILKCCGTREVPMSLVSMRKLEHTLALGRDEIRKLANRAGTFYQPFVKVDPKSGKKRTIDNPTLALKAVQTRIKDRILNSAPLPFAILGGVKGRSIVDNLRLHTRRSMVTCLDIRDCFPSISNKRIFGLFKNYFSCSEEIACLLTKLTTYHRRLPQGAPTSTILAAFALRRLFEELKTFLESNELTLSLWVDDITISGKAHRELIGPVVKIIQRHGFAVRNRKIKVRTGKNRQEVTGGVVNQGINIGGLRRREYRNAIANADLQDSRQLVKIRSKIAFVSLLNPAQAAPFRRLLMRRLEFSASRSKQNPAHGQRQGQRVP